ncbi:class I SAM-dependent methyltransferase [Paenibacillus humicola]|uniref:class I SAM-dependent methyltransferase n=1 Tax=Paenibacillus humicola TaxID=3110540 RepID=UPI00237C2C7D|nr:class I SAM-dependent methyltransferase [Paenibacillus humicola]
MPDHATIYLREAERYEQLVSKQSPLGEFMEQIIPFHGLDAVDLGAGTGRLTAVLAQKARSVTAVDASEAMLRVNADRLRAAAPPCRWQTVAADYRALPLEDDSADLTTAGWSICYAASGDVPQWRDNLAAIMAECRRVLRPGGAVVIFETMGTGHETPQPPAFLLPYYAALESEYGFAHRWIRTDYRFDDPGQAESLTRFFFGDELADTVRANRMSLLPECAGVWWRCAP